MMRTDHYLRRRLVAAMMVMAVALPSSRADTGGERPMALDAPARRMPPELPSAPAFSLPPIHTIVLDNGLRLFLVERHELPIVAFRVVTMRGVADTKPGVASLAAKALYWGTPARSPGSIEAAYRQIGMVVHYGYSYDAIWTEAELLSARFADGLPLIAEQFQYSDIPLEVFEAERNERLAASARPSDPYAIVRSSIATVLYPLLHPYHQSLDRDETMAVDVAHEDVTAFFQTQIRPDTTAVIVAGDVDAARLENLAKHAFGRWKAFAVSRKPIADVREAPNAQRITVLDRGGGTQAIVALAEVGVPRNHPDRDALAVLNAILGGIAGRLFTNLRETRGSTYTPTSFFEMERGPGPFILMTSVAPEKAAEVTSSLFAEIHRIVTEPVTADELALGRALVLRELPQQLTSLRGTVRALMDLTTSGRPIDDYAKLPERLAALTPEHLLAVAKRHLRPDAFRVFVLAQAVEVKDSFESLGLGRVLVQPADARPTPKSWLPEWQLETLRPTP